RFLVYYKTAPDLNASAKQEQNKRRNARLFVSIGDLVRFDNLSLKHHVTHDAGTSSGNLAWADIDKSYSVVEVKPEAAQQVIRALNRSNYNGRTVKAEMAGAREEVQGRPKRKFKKSFDRKRSWR